jgi:hypothetical protein
MHLLQVKLLRVCRLPRKLVASLKLLRLERRLNDISHPIRQLVDKRPAVLQPAQTLDSRVAEVQTSTLQEAVPHVTQWLLSAIQCHSACEAALAAVALAAEVFFGEPMQGQGSVHVAGPLPNACKGIRCSDSVGTSRVRHRGFCCVRVKIAT